jgi:hypothetical protein
MKTTFMTSLVIASFLATSAAQAAISGPVDELYSGMSAAAIQKDQRANPAAEQHTLPGRQTCLWREANEDRQVSDPLYAAYPGDGYDKHEKAYFSNTNLVC